MAISGNPTRTKTIEENWNRDINRRWKEFAKTVIGPLRRENELLTNANDPFVLSAPQQRTYLAFLEDEIQRLLLGTTEAPNWQARYQLQSYQRGLDDTRNSLLAQGADIIPTQIERLAAQGITPFTATPSLGTAVSGAAPIHRDALEFLFQRSYNDLKGWTDNLANETRQIMFSAVEEGKGIDEVTREMLKRIDVSRSRAKTIARTEVNQAYSRSAIAEVKRASEETGEEIKVRWLTAIVPTALGNPVRHSHAVLHGVVMDPERAAHVKTTDGVNCRCGLAPVIPEADTVAKRKKFAAERKKVVQSSVLLSRKRTA